MQLKQSRKSQTAEIILTTFLPTGHAALHVPLGDAWGGQARRLRTRIGSGQICSGQSLSDEDEQRCPYRAPDSQPRVPRDGRRARVAADPATRPAAHLATFALQAKIHPKVVQERLGHANVGITLDTYSHVAPTLHDEAAETVAGLLTRKAVDGR